MKIVAGILALMVLMLTFQPALSSIKTTTESECGTNCCANDEKLPIEDESPGDPCSDFCNPFLKCGGCVASTIEFIAFNMQKPIQLQKTYILSAQNVYSQFSPDFWQPPKLS